MAERCVYGEQIAKFKKRRDSDWGKNKAILHLNIIPVYPGTTNPI